MDYAGIAKILAPYGVVGAARSLCEQIEAYTDLLLRWNRKISLTAISDPAEIVRFHFGESFFASKVIPIQDGRLADVGSGAGFPGIPLAMVASALKVSLIEPSAKKCAFLAEVARSLNLGNVKVVRSRMETLSADRAGFDFVTARALGNYQSVVPWARNHLTSSGKLVLWLGMDESEVGSHIPSWNWREPIPIPNSRNRVILVGSPIPSRD